MKAFLKIWKDPVWSKVISTGIITSIGILISYLAGWLPIFLNFIKDIWAWLFQTTDIAHWLLILISIPCALVFYVVFLWLKSLSATEQSFESYISDNFFGLKWRWSYYYEGKISGDDVHCFCPSCDHQLFPQDASSYRVAPEFRYDCPDCGYSIGVIEDDYNQLRHKVILKVQKNIRTGKWKNI
mgnify:CR=1 FL=1